MHTRQKLLLLKTLQGINQRKYKFRKRTKMLLLIHHEFILKNLVYCMLGERALVRNFWMTNYHQHWFETIWRLRRHQFVSKFRLPSIITPFIFAPFAPSIRPFSFRSLWRKLKVDKNWRPTTINPIYSNQKCKIIIIIIIASLQQFNGA